MRLWLNRLLMLAVALLVVAAIAYAFVPQPIEVDTAAVVRGPLEVTVDEDGRTRLRERFIISAPLAGQMRRLTLDAGDSIEAGALVTMLDPTAPELLDPQAQAVAAARVQSAEAALNQARAMLGQAEAQLELAEDELQRVRRLAEDGAAGPRELDDAILIERIRRREREAAEFAVDVAAFELQQAEAALERTATAEGQPPETLEIRSPIDGRVLRVMQESEAVLTAGQPIVEIGDPDLLELEIDVLSTAAVRIDPGALVYIDHWGGEEVLRGTVRRVEPQAFTKISALGVEEQRVNVIIDVTSPAEQWQRLGDGYRVEVRIVTWREDDVLKAPTSALFRHDDGWAVFVVEGGRARVQPVRIGQTTGLETQIVEGLSAADTVVRHPSDRLSDGAATAARDEDG